MKWCYGFSAIAALTLSSASQGQAQSPVPVPVHEAHAMGVRCGALLKEDFSSILDAPTQVTDVTLASASGGIPAYCKVVGTIEPQIQFELRLSTTGWNGKFVEVGCGGWCGSVPSVGCDPVLLRGYACVATDTGHQVNQSLLWAAGNLQAQIDFGYRAIHVAALAGRAIAERYYATAARHAYFFGCSTGGYEGLEEAQRFPNDFDGIVVGAPDIDQVGANLRALWIARNIQDPQGNLTLSPDDLQLVHQAALDACDLDDGVRDGVIGNPEACHVDVRKLICRAGQSDRCLSAAKAERVARLYAGPSTSRGETISAGYWPGSELGWAHFWPASWVEQFFRYALPGFSTPEGWHVADFDFDRDPQRLALAAWYENSTPDLRRFQRAGGKLLMYHGATDTVDLPGAVTDYYELTERAMGGRQATQSFFRLFVLPGMNHCTGGSGAYAVDWLTHLEVWVEQGKAPERIRAAHIRDDYLERLPDARVALREPLSPTVPIAFTRPVFPYPVTARYRGKGDQNDERNFIPVTRSKSSR